MFYIFCVECFKIVLKLRILNTEQSWLILLRSTDITLAILINIDRLMITVNLTPDTKIQNLLIVKIKSFPG